jgi:DNA-binding transcriptional LysR family regulator
MSNLDTARSASARLAQVNLNLLVALDALLGEETVTLAAERLGVTQSAMSHSLAQLRALFGDPLIARSRGERRLTATAERLLGPLRRALHDVERLLGGAPSFEPSTSQRSFSVAAGDFTAVTLLPKLLAITRTEAPTIQLAVRPPDMRRMVDELETGDVELYLAVRAPDSPGLLQRKILNERFACVARKNHPALKGKLDLLTFSELPHALVTTQGEGPSLVDQLLANQGLKRQIVLRIPYFLAGPMVVANTDLVLTLPRRVAELLADRFELAVYEPPLALPGFAMQMVWHERFDKDPAHAWFRELVQRGAALCD